MSSRENWRLNLGRSCHVVHLGCEISHKTTGKSPSANRQRGSPMKRATKKPAIVELPKKHGSAVDRQHSAVSRAGAAVVTQRP